jgi:hypothetical protein
VSAYWFAVMMLTSFINAIGFTINTLFPVKHAADIAHTILSILQCYSLPAGILSRLRAVLFINETYSVTKVAKKLNVSCTFIAKWRDRAEQIFSSWPDELTDIKEKTHFLCQAFSDAPRSGTPAVYTAEQLCNLMSLALKLPTECGREMTHWTHIELADEANKQAIACGISKSTVGRFLKQVDIRPHHSIYWLNPNIKDEDTLKKEVHKVCETYHQAPALAEEGGFTVSVDEKTGIQALERISATKPMKQGSVEKREFEYKRHGTLSLTPSFDVVTGKIIQHRINETRGEVDFFEHIKQTIELSPNATWVFVADQLNVHKSESLVTYIAQQCGLDASLGVKGKEGILKNMGSREAFLIDKSHRIRFVFTPKHCSWLNQVEIWFGILSRKLLNRGSFSSLEDLRGKIGRFIDYFNERLAKPFKWTYKGKALVA